MGSRVGVGVQFVSAYIRQGYKHIHLCLSNWRLAIDSTERLLAKQQIYSHESWSTVSATPSVTRSPMSERPSPHSAMTCLTKSLLIESSPLSIERRRQHSRVLEWSLHEQLNPTERCLFWILANVPRMLKAFLVAQRDWIWWILSLWWRRVWK